MSVLLTEVEWWLIDRGIGHALAGELGHWSMTLCGQFGNFSRRTSAVPARICGACRDRLKADGTKRVATQNGEAS